MNGKYLAISIGVVAVAGVVGSLMYEPSSPPQQSTVDGTIVAVTDLLKGVQGKYPKASITEYRPITDELVKTGALPKAFLTGQSAKNAWDGKVVVQVFPQNAWKAGIAETINVVLEAVPESECVMVVQRLSQLSPSGIFQINVEPSKRVHTSFPVTGETGCTPGVNNVGYTVFAG